MQARRTIAIVAGVAGIAALAIAWYLLNDERKPDFPAIPGPPAAENTRAPVAPAPPSRDDRRTPGRDGQYLPAAPSSEPSTTPSTQTPAAAPAQPKPLSPEAAARRKAEIIALRKAALASPRDPERWAALARAHAEDGDWRLAAAAMRRATRADRSYAGRVEVRRLMAQYTANARKPPADRPRPTRTDRTEVGRRNVQ